MRAAWSLPGELVGPAAARGFLLLLPAQLGLSAQEKKLRLESSTELSERNQEQKAGLVEERESLAWLPCAGK